MAHAQKPDFVFRRNGRVHLNQRGRQFSRLLAAEVCASAVVMLDTPCSEVVWRVLATHSIRQFSPSLHLTCVTACHHISTGLYVNTNGAIATLLPNTDDLVSIWIVMAKRLNRNNAVSDIPSPLSKALLSHCCHNGYWTSITRKLSIPCTRAKLLLNHFK